MVLARELVLMLSPFPSCSEPGRQNFSPQLVAFVKRCGELLQLLGGGGVTADVRGGVSAAEQLAVSL